MGGLSVFAGVVPTLHLLQEPLGTNTDSFPLGRRLACEARGRLWVVCRNCSRWNLSPVEERWETIEGAHGFSAARGGG